MPCSELSRTSLSQELCLSLQLKGKWDCFSTLIGCRFSEGCYRWKQWRVDRWRGQKMCAFGCMIQTWVLCEGKALTFAPEEKAEGWEPYTEGIDSGSQICPRNLLILAPNMKPPNSFPPCIVSLPVSCLLLSPAIIWDIGKGLLNPFPPKYEMFFPSFT